MKNAFFFLLTMVFLSLASTAFGYGSFGTTLNTNSTCAPYTGDCTLCHTGSYSNSTPAKNAYLAGDWSYFCPTTDPADVDDDGDGFTENQGDCNDNDPAINPGAIEIPYNSIDENCNGLADDVVDADGDGFNSVVDCNDNDASINPGAAEIACDGIDQDCSGADSVDATCSDSDNDGFSDATDCAPNDPTINPSATEVCGDGIDQDCDGTDLACPTDPNTVDDDGDGLSEDQGDCNDTDALIYPGAEEICGDGIDQDCDGVDLECPPTVPACTDNDGDSFAIEGGECGPIDCNDNDPAINPAAAERCEDNVDNNCDGLADGQDTQACPAPPACTDTDADSFFAEADCNTVQDCDDNDNLTYPGAEELCGDQIDNDCDGAIDEGCDIVDVTDGVILYQDFCASCHGELSESNVGNEDADDIMEAIAENEGGMSSLSSLTDSQIKLIADALDGVGDDNADEDDESGSKENKTRGKKNAWGKLKHAEE